MRIAGINRRTALLTVFVLIPVEATAFIGLESVPLDVGYPPGTSAWWIAFGAAGLIIDFPVLWVSMLGQRHNYPLLTLEHWPHWFDNSVCFAVGLGDLLLLVLVAWLVVRVVRKLATG